VQNQTGVITTGGSRHLMGRFLQNTYGEIEQTRTLASRFDIGENYFQTLGFELVDGRLFDAQRATDIDQAVMVNETLVNQFGWSSIEGKSITFESQDSVVACQVIGVVRDFYPNGIDMRLLPAVLRLAPEDRYQFLSIKCDENNSAVIATHVQDSWKRLFPDRPYTGFWQVETMADAQETNNSIKLVFLYVAIMVIIISSMGLFALVSLNINRRVKEIGIRKVLGATMSNIGLLIAREFIWLIAIGSILASVLGYFLMDSLLRSVWTYYCDFGITPFVLAALFVLGVAVFTVGFQVPRSVR